jgi:hypothetical protein
MKRMIPIWFFVGCLLSAYGVLILIAAVQGESNRINGAIAMGDLHLQFWGGGILLILGLAWVIHYWPWHNRHN